MDKGSHRFGRLSAPGRISWKFTIDLTAWVGAGAVAFMLRLPG